MICLLPNLRQMNSGNGSVLEFNGDEEFLGLSVMDLQSPCSSLIGKSEIADMHYSDISDFEEEKSKDCDNK